MSADDIGYFSLVTIATKTSITSILILIGYIIFDFFKTKIILILFHVWNKTCKPVKGWV